MKTSLLEYYKTILRKVSFDHYLLNKEYRKAMRSLNTEEREELFDWFVRNQFVGNIQLNNQYSFLVKDPELQESSAA